jgi:hypothetical protein
MPNVTGASGTLEAVIRVIVQGIKSHPAFRAWRRRTQIPRPLEDFGIGNRVEPIRLPVPIHRSENGSRLPSLFY